MTALRPQPGPQEAFLSSPADIAIYGGAAGGGKSFGLLLDPLRAANDAHFRGVIFRREMPRITNPGGLWDEATAMYGPLGASFRVAPQRRVIWPAGASITFSHLQRDETVEHHKGAQYTWVAFDELTEFTERQFWYMLSRARSPKSSWRPWVRATTNPDAASWVRELLDWWIGDDGLAIPERSGVIRYVRRQDDALEWFDEPEPGTLSFTFIAATLDDNPALIKADPEYRTRLELLDRVEREKLLGGNWDASFRVGMFENHRVHVVPRHEVPDGLRMIRYWDLADTEVSAKSPDPDFTAGVLGALHQDEADGETLYIFDVAHFRLSGAKKRARIRATAEADDAEYGHVTQAIEQEGGATGSEVASDYQTTHLAGHAVILDRPQGDKVTRATRWLGLAERGRVVVVGDEAGRPPKWWSTYRPELESFPNAKRDQIDGTSGLYKVARTPVLPHIPVRFGKRRERRRRR